MLENIENSITRPPMDRLGRRWVVASHHVSDMSAMTRLPWQRPLPSNGALNILQSWASLDQTREPILMKFGIQQQIMTKMTVTWWNDPPLPPTLKNAGIARHIAFLAISCRIRVASGYFFVDALFSMLTTWWIKKTRVRRVIVPFLAAVWLFTVDIPNIYWACLWTNVDEIWYTTAN